MHCIMDVPQMVGRVVPGKPPPQCPARLGQILQPSGRSQRPLEFTHFLSVEMRRTRMDKG